MEKIGLKEGDKVIVGVSGGIDSVVLLHLFSQLKLSLSLELLVVHINHGLRGKESDKDQEFVRKLAASYHLPFRTETLEVKKAAKENKWSLEEAARILRYKSFNHIADEEGYEYIAVAHHRKDQGETLLMHLIRGSGLRGLKGMGMRRDRIIRPLLTISREEIEEYANNRGLKYRTDRSNRNTLHTRNSIRLKLWPLLKKYNPKIEESLVRTAAIAREDYSYLEEVAGSRYEALITEGQGRINISNEVSLEHPAIRSRIFQRAYAALREGHLEYRYLEELEAYISQKERPSQKLGLPGGIVAHRDKKSLILEKAYIQAKAMNFEEIQVPAPGIYSFNSHLMEVLALGERPLEEGNLPRGAQDGYCDIEKLSFPLTLRTRRPKDRFQALGQRISFSIKDLYIKRKIPRDLRGSLPLVIDSHGRIVFIPGIGISEEVKIEGKSRRFLHFSYR